MCGIAGYWAPTQRLAPESRPATIRAMTDAIAHRGPDADSFWLDDPSDPVLGHRRLSIIDLSPGGAQPMVSASGRFVLIYNGEIYNFQDMRRELEASDRVENWRGTSDTEVLLAAFEAFGIDEALRRAQGMFALALWDRETRTLTLARDRMGEKPLYYGLSGGAFLFGSELKALRAFPGFDPAIDDDAVAGFLLHACIPGSASIYRGVKKLPPGTRVTIAGPLAEQIGAPVAYWSLQEVVAARAHARTQVVDDEELLNQLEELLGNVVRSQMISDVPLGAFLSGGIDSSVVTAVMQRQSDRRVRTFSIGFDDVRYDESSYARAVADHLGTDHTELRVTEREALDMATRMGAIYDEPFADSSQIPSTLLARLARKDVTVALTGDGGDEVFGGYNRHVFGPKLWSAIERVPGPARRAAAAALGGSAGLMRALPQGAQQRALRMLKMPASVLDRAELFARVVREADTIDDVYALLNTNAPTEVSRALWQSASRHTGAREGLGAAERMMLLDSQHYLPDDVLVKVDRATMFSSLETRAPFLDARVVEFAWTMPIASKILDGRGKLPLRKLFAKYLPPHLLERPKQGFAVPLNDWLRGGLRDWADALLRADMPAVPAPLTGIVRDLWTQHCRGTRDAGAQLWPFLMLQAWCEANRA